MKIVLTRSMVQGDIQYLKDGLDKKIKGEYEFVVPSEFTEDGICEVCYDADILLGPFVTKKIIETAKNLKLIQVPWTGMDTFDFSCVKNADFPVCNTHSNADSVAELGVALLLDLLKKVSYHDRKMRAGNWNRDQQPLNLKSKMLSKQTVCIFGYGNIGSKIARLLSVFGAEIIAVDEFAEKDSVLSCIYDSSEINKAVKKADVMFCTLPLTEKTRHLFNDELFSEMKDGAILVNMSRADIVNEDAVWSALNDGKLGGFASDVWWNPPKRGETESYPSEKNPFWKLDNVLMSPHRAGFVEGCLPHLDGAIDNIIALAKNEKLSGIVDVNKGF